jgi:hypothetical protein
MEINSLSISGFRGEPVPNRFFQQQSSAALAVVFPGLGYHADLPVLYYPRLIALEHGADVLCLDTAYNRSAEYSRLSDSGQLEWIDADAGAALTVALAQRPYQRLLLIGKSLGSMAMGGLLDRLLDLPRSAWLWLTPVLSDERLVAQVARYQPLSLFVIGSADHYYDPAVLQQVTEATRSQPVVIDGADHSLEVKGQAQQSLQALQQVMAAVGSFISAWSQAA